MIHPLAAPFKPTGGLRLLRGNLAPDGGAVIKLAGVEGGMAEGRFAGRARVFDSEMALIQALASAPERFEDRDMVVIRYEGPRGAPGMPELLDPTSRITALCRRRGITIALMTDARFSGGSVGLVIGHVSPEAALGGPIALIAGRRHDRRGHPPRHPRLRRTGERGDARGAAGTLAGRSRTQRRYPPNGPARRHPAAPADARVGAATASRRRAVGGRYPCGPGVGPTTRAPSIDRRRAMTRA